MSESGRAKKLQRDTGVPLRVCYALERGDLVYMPQCPDCAVAPALAALHKGRIYEREGAKRVPCECVRCNP